MATETKPELILKEKVKVLRKHGVDVWDWKEPGASEFFPLPTVFFNGDEDEGHRVVEIMRKHGIYIWRVQRDWYYSGREQPHRVHWEMLFWDCRDRSSPRENRQPVHGFNSCSLIPPTLCRRRRIGNSWSGLGISCVR